MATIAAAAALAAGPACTCATISQRITITPGTVRTDALGVSGPLANDSWVVVAGISDGVYDV